MPLAWALILGLGGLPAWSQTAEADLLDESFDGKVGQDPPTGWTIDGGGVISTLQDSSVAIDEDEYVSVGRSGSNGGITA